MIYLFDPAANQWQVFDQGVLVAVLRLPDDGSQAAIRMPPENKSSIQPEAEQPKGAAQ